MKELLGRVRAGERSGSSCILSWRTNMEFNTKHYHIVIYSVCKTLFFDEESN